MNNLRAGDIFMFKAEYGFSKIIAWLTDSKYSHTGVVVSSEMSLLIEASAGGGVRATDIRKLNRDYDVFRIIETFSYDLNKVISFLVANLGANYDFMGVLYLGFLKLLRQKNKANELQRKNDWFCSELLVAAFQAGGIDIVPQVSEADVTSPGDISTSQIVEMVG